MNTRIVTAGRAAWALFVLAGALWSAGLLFLGVNGTDEDQGPSWAWLLRPWLLPTLLAADALAFAAIGSLVAARRPVNPLGWLFGAVGLLGGASVAATEYATYALRTRPGSLPGATLAAWLSSWLALPSLIGLCVFVLLLFPTGRLPSRRWQVVAWLALLGVALSALKAFRPGPLEIYYLPIPVANPFGLPGMATPISFAEPIGLALGTGSLVAATVAMLLRLRRARGVERQQLKWFAFGAALFVAVNLAAPITWFLPAFVVAIWLLLNVLASTFIPISLGVAMLRHRLFDIDRLINRTLVYGSLTIGLGFAYVGLILVAQIVSHPLMRGSDLAVAAATLAVAALFRPARGRIQGFVDQRFYRHKYDAERTVEAFRTRLRDEVDLDALGAELRAVVAETMHPAHMGLWVRDGSAQGAGLGPSRRDVGRTS